MYTSNPLVDFHIEHIKSSLENPEGFKKKYSAELGLDDQFPINKEFAVVRTHESFICLNQGQLQDVLVSVARDKFSAAAMVMVDDYEHVALAIK